MQLFVFLHTVDSIYPHRYVGSYIDDYSAELIQTEHYSVKHEEVQESAVLKLNVRETFLVATEDVDSTLETKYLCKKKSA